MRAEVIRSQQEFNHIKPLWDELYTRSKCAHPFASSCWIDSWMQMMSCNSKFQQHEWHILAIWQGSRLVAGVPLFVTSYGFGQIRLIRYLRPIGSDKNITEIRAPLIDPDYARDALDLIHKRLTDLSQFYDLMRWPDLPLSAEESERYEPSHCVEEYILPLAATWEDFRAGLKRNIKESIRKCYNAPARDGVQLDFKAYREIGAIKERLSDFYRLHQLRAAADLQPRHRDYFETATARRFIETFVQSSSTAEPVLFSLWHNDQMIAARLSFINNQSLYLYFSGYDPSYGRYSVMTRLVTESIRYAIELSLSQLNLSPGTDPSKLRWHPQRQTYLSHEQRAISIRGYCLQKLSAVAKSFRRPLMAKSADVLSTQIAAVSCPGLDQSTPRFS